MDNNEHKPFNPIARAREQANLASKHTVHTENEYAKKEDIDIFGNTEPLETKQTYENTSSFSNGFTPSNETKQEPAVEQNTVNETPELKTYTVSNNGVEEGTSQTLGETNFEEPKKEKKEKRVRVINSNDAVITPEDIKESRKYAWLAYILFFIPLCINRDNAFVRHNANEGLEIFIFDVLAAVLLILNAVIDSANTLVSFLLMLGSIVGVGLLILTTITKLYMIIVALMGKKANTPWFWNIRMIK